jgi:hypothetical protein
MQPCDIPTRHEAAEQSFSNALAAEQLVHFHCVSLIGHGSMSGQQPAAGLSAAAKSAGDVNDLGLYTTAALPDNEDSLQLFEDEDIFNCSEQQETAAAAEQIKQQPPSIRAASTPRSRLLAAAAEDADGSCLFSTPRRGERRLFSQHRAGLKGEAYHMCKAAAEGDDAKRGAAAGTVVEAGVEAAEGAAKGSVVGLPGHKVLTEAAAGAAGDSWVATEHVLAGADDSAAAQQAELAAQVWEQPNIAADAAAAAEGDLGLLALPSGDDACWLTAGEASMGRTSNTSAQETGPQVADSVHHALGDEADKAAAAVAAAEADPGQLPLPSYEEACSLKAPAGIVCSTLAGGVQDPVATPMQQQQLEAAVLDEQQQQQQQPESCKTELQVSSSTSNLAAAVSSSSSSSSTGVPTQPHHRPTLSCDMPLNDMLLRGDTAAVEEITQRLTRRLSAAALLPRLTADDVLLGVFGGDSSALQLPDVQLDAAVNQRSTAAAAAGAREAVYVPTLGEVAGDGCCSALLAELLFADSSNGSYETDDDESSESEDMGESCVEQQQLGGVVQAAETAGAAAAAAESGYDSLPPGATAEGASTATVVAVSADPAEAVAATIVTAESALDGSRATGNEDAVVSSEHAAASSDAAAASNSMSSSSSLDDDVGSTAAAEHTGDSAQFAQQQQQQQRHHHHHQERQLLQLPPAPCFAFNSDSSLEPGAGLADELPTPHLAASSTNSSSSSLARSLRSQLAAKHAAGNALLLQHHAGSSGAVLGSRLSNGTRAVAGARAELIAAVALQQRRNKPDSVCMTQGLVQEQANRIVNAEAAVPAEAADVSLFGPGYDYSYDDGGGLADAGAAPASSSSAYAAVAGCFGATAVEEMPADSSAADSILVHHDDDGPLNLVGQHQAYQVSLSRTLRIKTDEEAAGQQSHAAASSSSSGGGGSRRASGTVGVNCSACCSSCEAGKAAAAAAAAAAAGAASCAVPRVSDDFLAAMDSFAAGAAASQLLPQARALASEVTAARTLLQQLSSGRRRSGSSDSPGRLSGLCSSTSKTDIADQTISRRQHSSARRSSTSDADHQHQQQQHQQQQQVRPGHSRRASHHSRQLSMDGSSMSGSDAAALAAITAKLEEIRHCSRDGSVPKQGTSGSLTGCSSAGCAPSGGSSAMTAAGAAAAGHCRRLSHHSRQVSMDGCSNVGWLQQLQDEQQQAAGPAAAATQHAEMLRAAQHDERVASQHAATLLSPEDSYSSSSSSAGGASIPVQQQEPQPLQLQGLQPCAVQLTEIAALMPPQQQQQQQQQQDQGPDPAAAAAAAAAAGDGDGDGSVRTSQELLFAAARQLSSVMKLLSGKQQLAHNPESTQADPAAAAAAAATAVDDGGAAGCLSGSSTGCSTPLVR